MEISTTRKGARLHHNKLTMKWSEVFTMNPTSMSEDRLHGHLPLNEACEQESTRVS